MSDADYRDKPWFALLRLIALHTPRQQIAERLGVAPPMVTQVLNGSGKYGAGQASTHNLAQRVLHIYGPPYLCPHLSERDGAPREVEADYCRRTAHAAPPTGSPQAMQHWQACRGCEHKHWSAPFAPKQPGRPRPTRPKVIEIVPCNPTSNSNRNEETQP